MQDQEAAVGTLQQLLEQIYDLNIQAKVGDFLVTDEHTIRALEGANFRAYREKLLVCESEDELLLSLYLDPRALECLCLTAPVLGHGADHLEAFWTVLEGISHFIYLARNAGYNRSVKGLELELQAEVDKYIVTATLEARHLGGDIPSRLHRLLFEEQAFDHRLEPAELIRYRDANHFAGKYCQGLARRFRRVDHVDLKRELRRFYRLAQSDKLRFIEAAAPRL